MKTTVDPTRPRETASRRVLVIIVAVAVATDVFGRDMVGIGGALLAVGAAAGLLGARSGGANPRAWPVVLAVPAVGVWLALRTTHWLIALDLLAIACLLVLGASLGAGGDPFDLTAWALARRGVSAGLHLLRAPGFVRPTRRPGPATVRVGRGLLLAAPLVVLLGVLLRSADPVFASYLRLPVDAGGLGEHLLLLVAGAWTMAGLLRILLSDPPAPRAGRFVRLGTAEALVVLGLIVGLFAMFALTQVVAAAGGARHVLETEGLTYAEYARSGFFQLLAAAAITLAVLATLRAVVEPSRAFTALAEAAVALTLVIVVVALRRLHLYEHAYGLTALRLVSSLFAWWIGSVFVMLGLALAGVHRRRAWLVPGALASALVVLLLLNAAGPDALVVRRNLDHYQRTGRIDIDYLTTLSPDAIPAAARLDDPRVRAWICQTQLPSNRGLSYNAARGRAADVQARICPRA